MAETKIITPGFLDLQTGKLVIRCGEGSEQTFLYDGKELKVMDMNINIDYGICPGGRPVVRMTIIP